MIEYTENQEQCEYKELVIYKDGCFGPSEYIASKLRRMCTELEPCSGNSCGFCFDREDEQVIAIVKQAIANGDESAYIMKLPINTTDYTIMCMSDYDDSEYVIYAADGKIHFKYD